MRKKVVFGVVALATVSLTFLVAVREPRLDRTWDEEVQYTATAVFNEDGTATVNNVRDFTYGDSTVISTDWVSRVTIHPDDIVKVWFVLEPFSKWEAVGHTFLTFELTDGSAFSFSVEARREKGETYSALRGLFNEYELAYSWGTERDFVTRRLLYLKNSVRMYPLTINESQARGLFIGLLKKTNEIAKKPRFYNTLTANCTNILAQIVNDIQPKTIPLDISWYLPGYSDRFLMRIGLIQTDKTIENAREAYDVTKNRSVILDIATAPHSQFGKDMRALLP